MEYEQAIKERRELVSWLKEQFVKDLPPESSAAQRAYASGKNDIIASLLKRLEGR